MRTRLHQLAAPLLACLVLLAAGSGAGQANQDDPTVVQCANLVYANNKTSTCFADEFLRLIETKTNIVTSEHLTPVHLESPDLFHYPFAIMSGDNAFELTPAQRDNLRHYIRSGGFLVASAGCGSQAWADSMRKEIAAIFPKLKLKPLAMDHPIFHTVFNIHMLGTNLGGIGAPIEGLEMDGKIVLVLSPDGLNDTQKAGPGCCCCGGTEIHELRELNANLLAYALTH